MRPQGGRKADRGCGGARGWVAPLTGWYFSLAEKLGAAEETNCRARLPCAPKVVADITRHTENTGAGQVVASWQVRTASSADGCEQRKMVLVDGSIAPGVGRTDAAHESCSKHTMGR